MPLYEPEREIKLLTDRIHWHETERKKYLVRMRRWFLINVFCASGGVVVGAILTFIFCGGLS